MNRAGIIVLVMCLFLTACDSSDKEDSVELAAVPQITATATPRSTPLSTDALTDTKADPLRPDLVLPVMPGLARERLIFAYDGTLYVGAFDGSEPQVLVQDVPVQMVSIAPDQRHLVVVISEGWNAATTQLALVDAVTLDTISVIDIDGRIDLRIRWSPDAQWFAFSWFNTSPLTEEQMAQAQAGEPVLVPYGSPPTLMIVGVDGEARATEFVMMGQSWSWLLDSTLLAAIMPDGREGGSRETLATYDPVTNATDTIDEQAISGALWQVTNGLHSLGFWRTAQAALAPLGLELTPPDGADYWQSVAISPGHDMFVELADVGTTYGGPCRGVALIRKAITAAVLPEIIYQSGGVDTLGIVMIKWLPDDTLLFVLQTGEACDFTQAEGTLMRLLPSGDTTVLAENVDTWHRNACDITHDGRYTACIRLEGDRSSVDLIALDGGAVTELLAAPAVEQEDLIALVSPFSELHWLLAPQVE